MIARLRDTFQNAVADFVGKFLWPSTAAAGIILEKDTILLINFQGQFCLPGGIAKSFESTEKTLEREVREETGLEVRTEELLHIDTEMKYPRVLLLYRCIRTGGRLETSWEGKPEYVALDRLPDQMRENHRELIHMALEKESSGSSPG